MPRAKPNTFSVAPNPELVEALKNPPKQRCIVGQLIAEHPNGKDIAEALNNPRWSSAQLAGVLAQHTGQPLRAETITKHRNTTCNCER